MTPDQIADLYHLTQRGWRFSIGEQSISAYFGNAWRIWEEYPRGEMGAFQDALQYVITTAIDYDRKHEQ